MEEEQERSYQNQLDENAEENDSVGMFDDVDMKLKAIVETLQGQIEEMRQRIQELEKEVWRKRNENKG